MTLSKLLMFDNLIKIQLLMIDNCLNNVEKVATLKVKNAMTKIADDNVW